MASLRIQNLDKLYDRKVEVLRQINLEAQEGEFLVLVGPSGCGKSTLLRIIAGLEKPTRGDVYIGEQRVNDLSPMDRNIAMVFQDYALYPHMTVFKNLAFGLNNRRLPKAQIEARIDEASKLLQIEHLLERKPAQLSGGQRQRVAIGRTIIRQPSLFLFDEPLSNLDAQMRAEMRIEIASIHNRSGSTSVYVTHDQVEAMTLATRIAVLNRGIIQQIGEPLELYHRPTNRFVASFMGIPSINFLGGELEFHDGKKLFHADHEIIDVSAAHTPVKPGRFILGIRPESIKPALGGATPHMTLNAVMIEPYGHENHLIAKFGKQQVISRYSSPERMARYHHVRRGEAISATVDFKAVHWFSTDEEGQRIQQLEAPMRDHGKQFSLLKP